MRKTTAQLKKQLIEAGEQAVEELIKVAKEPILKTKIDFDSEDADLAADRLKNAAAAKKLAIFDAFEILKKIEEERELLGEDTGNSKGDKNVGGFAENRAGNK